MQTWVRYLLLVFGMLIILHSILRFSHEDYNRATSLTTIIHGDSKKAEAPLVPDAYYFPTGPINSTLAVDRRANATFVILARNSDINGALRSVRDIEDRFNKGRGYPYVFLNEEPFTEDFKKRVSVLSASLMEFGQIPREHWYQPDTIDEAKASEARRKMEEEKIIYGGAYRNMCRYNSGFFFKHDLMQKYRWYWRIEPEVHFHCDLSFDPFLFMEDNDKVYGWTITMYEFEKTIPTLWGHVRDFMGMHPELIAEDNALGFMSHDGGNKYNLCHFWSNFEIADMEFWRGSAYTAFFEYLDSTGGFYYERWGDAPVHSIAAAIFANKTQLHFFDEIGYEHNPYTHCPQKEDTWKKGRCSCDQSKSFDYDGYSCMKKWDDFIRG
ncbi:glycosyltransferase family 15 protein [Lyophyllum atratum]|nr:glycosyltransferase family 15 protein [Lyophyllum atratum]